MPTTDCRPTPPSLLGRISEYYSTGARLTVSSVQVITTHPHDYSSTNGSGSSHRAPWSPRCRLRRVPRTRRRYPRPRSEPIRERRHGSTRRAPRRRGLVRVRTARPMEFSGSASGQTRTWSAPISTARPLRRYTPLRRRYSVIERSAVDLTGNTPTGSPAGARSRRTESVAAPGTASMATREVSRQQSTYLARKTTTPGTP